MTQQAPDHGPNESLAGNPTVRWDAGARRAVVGLAFGSAGRHLHSALVVADGHGLMLRPRIAASAAVRLPDDLTETLRGLSNGKPMAPLRLAAVEVRLAEIAASATLQLAMQTGMDQHEILAIGLRGPGIWLDDGDHDRFYRELCDSTRLAETTGMNVIDNFPARDLAQRGRGGPLEPLAYWLLLADRSPVPGRRIRALLVLERTIHVAYLPSHSSQLPRLTAFDVGPGMSLLDELALRITHGAQASDGGGHLAVQGCNQQELLDCWLESNVFESAPWNPRGVSPQPLLQEAYRLSAIRDWSLQDVLCTATHLVAASVAQAISERMPKSEPVGEILVTGGGGRNGFLLCEIERRLPGRALRLVEELGIPDSALPAACAGVLALMHIDHVSANPLAVTGAEVSRVLGRLTPGSPSNWYRLLDQLARREQTRLPLRNAI